MQTRILLTSFQTWLPHQKSNSADDLLAKIQQLNDTDGNLLFLRKLPVDTKLASLMVIAAIKEIHPNLVICCGMAEKRYQLSIESNARCQDQCLYTSVDLTKLTQQLVSTAVSHDAGKFVCEGLYYQVLKHIQTTDKKINCIFVHVPLLTDSNLGSILQDFQALLSYLRSQ